MNGSANRDTDPSLLRRYVKNFGRNVKATGPYFLIGILLSALFQRYVPADAVTYLFGGNEALGVLMAATVGVPLYACGGGTIPLRRQWDSIYWGLVREYWDWKQRRTGDSKGRTDSPR